MPHAIGFVDNSGGTLAHYKMLDKIRALAIEAGWTVLRYDTVQSFRELILMAPGLSGEEQIYCGFKCYHDVALDVYNLTVAGYTGYVPGNDFYTQPGAMYSGIPTHNQRIDYWITANAQRMVLGMKVGTPVYEHAYIGYGLTRALPSQYPYPLVCAGMLNAAPYTRFSETTHSMPYKGITANMRLRFNSGVWLQPATWPWNQPIIYSKTTTSDNNQVRDTEGVYPLLPIILMDANGIYCELDGVFAISGFDNVTENTFVIGDVDYVVLQDVARNGFIDYIAMRMDS